jgi:hypothetical protein
MWLGHFCILLVPAAVIASVADDAMGQPRGVIDVIVAAVWGCWIAAMLADRGVHQERLCERCVAATPLDPQAAVDRWRRVLRLHHERRAMFGMLGGVLAWDIVDGMFRHPPAWVLAGSAVTTVAYGAAFAVTWQHRRLWPWCPVLPLG